MEKKPNKWPRTIWMEQALERAVGKEDRKRRGSKVSFSQIVREALIKAYPTYEGESSSRH